MNNKPTGERTTSFTKDQLLIQARENVKALKMAAVQTAFKDIRPAIELDLALAEITLTGIETELECGKIRRFELDMSDCDSCGQDCGADMVEDLDGDYVLWEEVLPYLYQHADYDKPQTAPVVPAGYTLVPIEPTEDMIIAGFESEPDESFSKPEEWEQYEAMSGCQQAAHRTRLCWNAMIAAAPEVGGS